MKIKATKAFERELKKLKKKHFPIEILKPCVAAIVAQDQATLKRIKDHAYKENGTDIANFIQLVMVITEKIMTAGS